MAIILKILPLEVSTCRSFTEVGMFDRYLLTQATPSQRNQRSSSAISSTWICSLWASDKCQGTVKAQKELRIPDISNYSAELSKLDSIEWILGKRKKKLVCICSWARNKLQALLLLPALLRKSKKFWVMSSWRGFARGWAVLSLPWIVFMFDSAEPQLGKQRAGLLLLNWTGLLYMEWIWPDKISIKFPFLFAEVLGVAVPWVPSKAALAELRMCQVGQSSGCGSATPFFSWDQAALIRFWSFPDVHCVWWRAGSSWAAALWVCWAGTQAWA